MRLAILQISPSLGEVKKNITRATTLLDSLPQSQLDLIILPELAFTGYNFLSPKQITPFIETRSTSPSREWAQAIARQFRSSVVIGLPTQDTHRCNTASIIDSTGNVVHEYYKHHMFETDYKWGCTPGPGFNSTILQVNDVPIHTSIGICMDINPKEFTAPFTSYEYANFILNNDKEISLILLPMAWLLPPEYDQSTTEPSLPTLRYWIKRLYPLVQDDKLRAVVICNRTGEDDGRAVYAGTSCVLRLGGGEVSVLGMLGREEGVLYLDLEL